MSRSRRQTPIHSFAVCDSERYEKRRANRAFRRETRAALAAGEDPPIDLDEVSDVWTWGKDGKTYNPEGDWRVLGK